VAVRNARERLRLVEPEKFAERLDVALHLLNVYLPFFEALCCTTDINRAKRIIRRTLSEKRRAGACFCILKTTFRRRLSTMGSFFGPALDQR